MASKDSDSYVGVRETEQSEKGQNPPKINCPTDNSSSSSQQEVEILPEAGKKGNDAGHGNRFQSKLLILYALRAINFGYPFYLGTELSVGEKFDDLIFHYKIQNDVTFRQQYLQAKNKLNEIDPRNQITANDLLDVKNGDFSLLKYFQTYVKIKSYGNNVEHFLICTNVDFNPKNFPSNGIQINQMKQKTWPKLLDCKNVKNEQNCYKFQVHGNFKSILTGNILQCIQNCTGVGMKCLFQNCKEIINGKQFIEHTDDEMKIFFSDPQNQMQVKKLVEVVLTNDFLEKLVFAVKMPNEDELDDILTKEVGKYFQLSNADLQSDYIMNKMVNWFKLTDKEPLWLTAKYAEYFLKKKAGEHHRTFLSLDYQRQTLKLGVLKFDNEVVRQLTDILKEFWDSKEKIKRIKSETPKLTAVKFISAIQKMPRFKNDDDYLVISSKKLKENVNQLEESKRAEKCHHLFVVVDEDAENPLENDTSYQNSIPPDIKKKIIVISKNVSPGDSTYTITYGQLNENTKKVLDDKQVSFQGSDLTVNDLIDMKQANNKILNSQLIENLLQTAEDNKFVVPSFNTSSLGKYIERKLKFPSKDQLLKKLADIEEKPDKKVNEQIKVESKKMNEEIEIDQNGKIKWKTVDDERKQKIWKDLKILLEQTNSSDLSLLSTVNERELIDASNKRIIITDVAGTGKSTILSNYYEEIKKFNSDKLVIKISLMNYSESLTNEKSINKFLINNVVGQNLFARQLLKHRLETGDRIILMLDGFNEIDTKCQKKVVELVKTLNESIPLYITTRPHLADQLQFELSQLAYRLDRFTEKDQINYLTVLWEEYFKEVSYNEETIKTFARQLIDRVNKTLKDKEKEFIGIPLQCRILAECFQSKIKDEIIREPNSDLSHLIGGQKFDLVHLYKSLINEKRRIFHQEKIEENSRKTHIIYDSIENTINETEHHLRKLAIQLIVNKQEDVNILIPSAGFKSKSEKEKKEKQLNEFGIRFGLVDDKGENGMQFLHRTFAEYLVADFIFKGFLLDEEKHNNLLENELARKWIIEEMLIKDNYEGVRVFFDSMLKEIFNDKEWRNGIQKNHLPLRLQQFASFIFEEKTPALGQAFREINSNISLLIFDCLDVTFHESPSKIPPVINFSLKIVNIFRLRIDNNQIDRLLNYFDNAVNDDLSQFTEYLIHELNEEKQQIENKKLESFLNFVGRHVKSNWDFHELTVFFIRSKMDKKTRKQLFEILSSKYSTDFDFDLTRLMKDAIITSLDRYGCPIGEIEKALTILRFLGRIEVVANLSRFVLLRESETLKKKENANVRLSLEKIGMTGLHGAAFKGDLSLLEKEIGCSLENPENCSEKEIESVFYLMTNEKDLVPPLYLAVFYGHDDICKKIFRFLDLKKEISDAKGFLHRSLNDVIKYENVLMIQTILKSVKEILGQDGLVKLLQSVNFYFTSKLVRETIVSIFLQDKENGYRDLNDLVFYDWKTLRILVHVQCDALQKMITTAGGLHNWIKRLMDTNLKDAFWVLSFDLLDKLNQENQISKLIDILITRSSPNNTRASPKVLTRIVRWWRKMSGRRQPSISYWSDFVKKYCPSEIIRFLGAISKFVSEEDLKRLLLYRDDNNILILLQCLIRNGRSQFNFLSYFLPQNPRKEFEDLSEEEKPKLIDHFFSTSTFLQSLNPYQQFNAIEYYLENGNEKQLAKFSQVVQVHQLEKDIKGFWEKEQGNKIAGLLKEKLDSQTVIKYNEFIEKLSS